MSEQLDLHSIFKAVAGTLSENKESLNQADSYNGDHGDNMVNIFNMVTKAVSEKKDADVGVQLAHASKVLEEQNSGSAQAYAKGFASAAQQFQGKQVTADNAMGLLQSMLSAGEEPVTEDPVQGLLGGLFGGDSGDDDPGFDVNDLLSAGKAFLTAKNRGESTKEALIGAVISASPMGKSDHRTQSSQMVANTIFDAIGSFSKK